MNLQMPNVWRKHASDGRKCTVNLLPEGTAWPWWAGDVALGFRKPKICLYNEEMLEQSLACDVKELLLGQADWYMLAKLQDVVKCWIGGRCVTPTHLLEGGPLK